MNKTIKKMQRWRYFKLSLTYRKFPQMVLCDILCKLGPYIPVNPSLYLLQKKTAKFTAFTDFTVS